MSYASDRSTTLKLDASPSMLNNNLAAGATKLAFIHKDAVYLLDLRSVDGRASPVLEKLPVKDQVSSVTQVAWCELDDRCHFVVSTRSGLSIWDTEAQELLKTFSLADFGFSTPESALPLYLQGIASSPACRTMWIGTSWGDVMPICLRGEEFSILPALKAHTSAITSLASDDTTLVSADGAGNVIVWDVASSSIRETFASAGHPCTCVAMRGDIVLATFTTGHLRIFRCGTTSKERNGLEVEITAHARSITALHLHPSQYTFATVGEDSMVNVWSLPEMASTGKTKVTLDMSTRVADTMFVGVQFAKYVGKATAPHLICTAYDSHVARVFLGL